MLVLYPGLPGVGSKYEINKASLLKYNNQALFLLLRIHLVIILILHRLEVIVVDGGIFKF